MTIYNGYSTDQFLNFKDYEKGSPVADGQDNPLFAYPGNRAPNVYDRAGDTTNYHPGLVQRGFIRGIFPEILNAAAAKSKTKTAQNAYTSAATNAVTRRCFFQFNPSLILRSVEASTTVLNPLLQPATELLQPIPGQAAFEFQLLFNREREVSGHSVASGFDATTGDPTMSTVDSFSKTLSNYGVEGNPYKREHVADLGVLADLYVLDSIIGQSITQDSIDTLLQYWDITQKSRVATKSVVENQDGSTTTTTSNPDGSVAVVVTKDGKTTSTKTTPSTDAAKADGFFQKQTTKDKLASVLGNSAFLSPLPVRIVFSSLFMVEGFVTSSNVAFHKFSSTMIPTVCSVTLNVQALYLGFAKKESYVSQQLTTQLQTTIANGEEEAAAKAIAKKGLEEGLKINLNTINPHGSVGTLGEGIDSLNSWWSYGVTNKWDFSQRNVGGIGPRFDSGTNRGLQVYIDENLRKLVNTNAVQNILIDKIELLFIKKDKIPKQYKDARALQNAINKGSYPTASRNSNGEVILRTDINIVEDAANNSLGNGAGKNGESPGTYIESAKIENSGIGAKGSKNKKLKYFWQSNPIVELLPSIDHFGTTPLVVVMIVQMSCNYASGTNDTSVERVFTRKSVILDNVSPTDTTINSFVYKNNPSTLNQSGLWV
jgi:hypothetical protein